MTTGPIGREVDKTSSEELRVDVLYWVTCNLG